MMVLSERSKGRGKFSLWDKKMVILRIRDERKMGNLMPDYLALLGIVKITCHDYSMFEMELVTGNW